MDVNPTQHIKTTHPDSVNSKPQGGVLSPTLFNIYPSDIPPPSAPVQVTTYANSITITSTHINTNATKKQNNLNSFHAGSCRIYEQSGPKINNKALPMATHPKVLGLTLDPKITYSTHIHNILVHAHTSTTS